MQLIAGGKVITRVCFYGADAAQIVMLVARLLAVCDKQVLIVDLSNDMQVYGNVSYPGENGIIEIKKVNYARTTKFVDYEFDIIIYVVGTRYDSRIINRCDYIYIVHDMSRQSRGVCAEGLYACKKPVTLIYTEFVEGMKEELSGNTVENILKIEYSPKDKAALYRLVEEGIYDYGALSDGMGEAVRNLTTSILGVDVPEEAYGLAEQSLL